MIANKLPRWDLDSPLLHGQMNQLAEAIERADSWTADASVGLLLTEGLSGRVLTFDAPPALAAIQLSGQLPAGDGKLQCGRGPGKVLGFNPATAAFAPDPAALPVDVFNLLNVKIANGSTILAGQAYGQWFYLLTICGNGVA